MTAGGPWIAARVVVAACVVAGASLVVACASNPPVPPGSTNAPIESGAATATATPTSTTIDPSRSASDTPPTIPSASPASPAPTPSHTPVATTDGSPRPTTIESDDGLLTVDLLPGSIPDGITVTASARGQADLPPELVGLEIRSAFYALEPADLALSESGIASRQLSMSTLGFDPSLSGVPVVLQAIRGADTTWEWLPDQQYAWHGADTVAMTGGLEHLGQLFGFGGTAFIEVAAEPGLAVPVDAAFMLVITLRYDTQLDPDRRPAFMTDVTPFGPPAGVTFGDISLTSAGATGVALLRIPVICDQAGEAAIGAEFGVSNMGAGAALLGELGLPDTTITVAAGLTVECLEP